VRRELIGDVLGGNYLNRAIGEKARFSASFLGENPEKAKSVLCHVFLV